MARGDLRRPHDARSLAALRKRDADCAPPKIDVESADYSTMVHTKVATSTRAGAGNENPSANTKTAANTERK